MVIGIWTFILFVGVYGLVFIQPFHPEYGPYCTHPQQISLIYLDDNVGAGWCWIDQRFFWARILSFYGVCILLLFLNIVFVFVDMFGLIILYGVLFIYIRIQLKNLHAATSSSDHDARINLESGNNGQFPTSDIPMTNTATATTEGYQTRRAPAQLRANQAQQRMNQVSRTLLLYPLVYIVVLLPLSVARLMQFANKSPSLKATYVVCAIFDCQGLINVFLYTFTRKGIIPWDSLLRKFKRDPISPNSDYGTDTSRTVIPTPSMASLNQSNFRTEHSASDSYLNLGSVTSDNEKFGHDLGQKDTFDDDNRNFNACNYGRGNKEV